VYQLERGLDAAEEFEYVNLDVKEDSVVIMA
jgi:hypothetical protein